MKHRFVECRIGCVTVAFPTPIGNIKLDAAPNRLAAVYPDRSIAKIRPGFAVPCAELDDIDFVTGRGDKVFAEISRKPARLQLQFIWNARRDKQRTLTNPRGIA